MRLTTSDGAAAVAAVDYRAPQIWQQISALLLQTPPIPSESGGVHHCEPGWTWQPELTDFDLWLVVDGRGRGTINDLAVDLEPGTLLVFRPGDTGDFSQDPDHRLSVVSCHFSFESSTGVVLPTGALLPHRLIMVQSLGLLTGLIRRLLRSVRDPSPLRAMDARALLVEVLTEVYRQDARSQGIRLSTLSPQLQDAIDLIVSDPARRHTLAEVAASVEVSSRQLSGLFSTQLGVTFREFLVESRLGRARTLLAETTMSINQIAGALGYADQFLLSRQFRAWFGEPPSQYRSSIRNTGRS